MKYIKEYLETVVKIKPLGELTTEEDELNDLSGEMVYIDGKCSDIFISHADYANWLENKYEQKSVDKVGTKFKAGDWVASDYNNVAYIESISETKYNLRCKDGYHDKISIEYIDRCWHLWSIKDAKPGDVIAEDPIERHPSSFVAIYKKQNEEDFDTFDSYCFVGFDGKFYEGEYGHSSEDIHPATKEQRELLFEKMHEAGYTFDFEKKELKKLKFRVGDEVITENEGSLTITKINKEGYWSNDLFICDFDEECIWDLVEQKPTEWSKEDIGIIEGMIIDYRGEIEHLSNSTIDEQAKPIYQERIDFLNRLKTCCPELYNVQKKIDNAIYLIEHYATHGHDKNLRNKVIDELEYVKHELEKQCEQKSTDNLTQQEAMDIAVAKCFEQGGQKPVDKVEPKFNIGDWIVSDLDDVNEDFRLCKIIGIEDGCYTIQSANGCKGYNFFEIWESDYHLWSIEDAKDGDILVSQYNKPFIYNGNYNEYKVGAYCGIDTVEEFFIDARAEKCWTNNESINPATKEQRDMLFQKMHEAGYTFDFEKKELKKIEPLTDFEKAFHGMCCEKNKQFAKECCKTLIELARKQLQSERNELELDEISYKVGLTYSRS